MVVSHRHGNKAVSFEEEESATSSMKQCQPEEGVDELEEYRDARRNHVKQGTCDLSCSDGSISSCEFQDGDDESIVDFKANPTQLYLRINYKLWDMALSTLQSRPKEAQVWIQQKDQQKQLPIHVACAIPTCPESVVSALLEAYPECLQCADSKQRRLPLHIACGNSNFITNHQNLLKRMAQQFPPALILIDSKGATPIHILHKHKKKGKKLKSIIRWMEEAMDNLEKESPSSEPTKQRRTLQASEELKRQQSDSSDDAVSSRAKSLIARTQIGIAGGVTPKSKNGKSSKNLFSESSHQTCVPAIPFSKPHQITRSRTVPTSNFSSNGSSASSLRPVPIRTSYLDSDSRTSASLEQPDVIPGRSESTSLFDFPSSSSITTLPKTLSASQPKKLSEDAMPKSPQVEIIETDSHRINAARAIPSRGQSGSDFASQLNKIRISQAQGAPPLMSTSLSGAPPETMSIGGQQQLPGILKHKSVPSQQQSQKPKQSIPLPRKTTNVPNSSRGTTIGDASSDGGTVGHFVSSTAERRLYYSKPLVDNLSAPFDGQNNVVHGALANRAARDAETGEIQYKEQVAGFQRDDDESLSRQQMEIRVNESSSMHDDEASTFEDSTAGESILESALRDINSKYGKTAKENSMLKKKLSILTGENAAMKSCEAEREANIHQLKGTLEQERSFSRDQVRTLEIKLSKVQDNFVEAETKADSKSKSEQMLAKRVSQLESNLASKKVDLSTIRAAFEEEQAAKAVLQVELISRKDDQEIFETEIERRKAEIESLTSQVADVWEELRIQREIDKTQKERLAEMERDVDQKEIQIRAMTEAMGLEEKRVKKLQESNEELSIKGEELKQLLRENTETFQSRIEALEGSHASQLSQNLLLQEEASQRAESMNQTEIELDKANTEKMYLEDLCSDLRGKESRLDEVEKELHITRQEKTVWVKEKKMMEEERTQMADAMLDSRKEIERKAHRIDDLERRLDAMYTEMVAQQRREAETEQKNKELLRRLEAAANEDKQNTTKLQVLKTAVHSYKSEMERYLSRKQSDDEKAAKCARKLAEKEQELERAKQQRSALEATIEGTKSSENSLLQQVKEIAERETRAYERIDSFMKHETELKGQITGLKQEVENSIALKSKIEEEKTALSEKTRVMDEDYRQMRELCEQKTKSEEEHRLECSKVHDYNRLQKSLNADLEASIKDLRMKHFSLCEEHENLKSMASRKDELNCVLKEESERDRKRVIELTTVLDETKQKIEQGEKKMAELEEAINAEKSKNKELYSALEDSQQAVERHEKMNRKLTTSLNEMEQAGEMEKKKKKQELDVTLDGLRDECERYKRKNRELVATLDDLQQTVERQEKKNRELSFARDELEQEGQRAAKNSRELTAALDEAKQEVQREKKKISELESTMLSSSVEHKNCLESELSKNRQLAMAVDELKEASERDGKKAAELEYVIAELSSSHSATLDRVKELEQSERELRDLRVKHLSKLAAYAELKTKIDGHDGEENSAAEHDGESWANMMTQARDLEGLVRALRQSNRELLEECERLRAQTDKSTEGSLQDYLLRLQKNIGKLKEEAIMSEEAMDAVTKANIKLQDENSSLRNQMKERANDLDESLTAATKLTVTLHDENNQLKKAMEEKTDETNLLGSKVFNSQVMIAELEETNARLETRNADLHKSMDAANERFESVIKELKEVNQTLKQQLEEEESISQETINSLNQANAALQDEVKVLKQKMQPGEVSDDALASLTQINCENLLRIRMLAEREQWAQRKLQERQRVWEESQITFEEQVDMLNKSLDSSTKTIDELKTEIATSSTSLAQSEKSLDVATKENNELKANIAETSSKLAEKIEEIGTYKSLAAHLEQKIRELESMAEKTRISISEEKESSSLKAVVDADSKADLQKKITKLQSKLETLSLDAKTLTKSLDEKCQQLDKSEGTLKEKCEELKQLKRERIPFETKDDTNDDDDLKQKNKEQERRIEELQTTIALLRADLTDNLKVLASLRSRDLSEMEESTEWCEERSLLNEKLASLTEALHRSIRQNENLEERVKVANALYMKDKEQQETIDRLTTELVRLSGELSVAKIGEPNDTQTQKTIEKLKDEIKTLKEDLRSQLGKHNAKQAREFFKRYDEECETLKSQHENVTRRMKKEIDKLQSDLLRAQVTSEKDQEKQETVGKLKQEIDALKTDFNHKLDRQKEKNTSETVDRLKSEINDLKGDIQCKHAELTQSNEMNKSYQIEIGRLLKASQDLREKSDASESMGKQTQSRIDEMHRTVKQFEKESMESSLKLLNILSKFDANTDLAQLDREKERLQKEYEKQTKSNSTKSNALEYLTKNIELLETKVSELTSTHSIIMDEAQTLRSTITEQDKTIYRLEKELQKDRSELSGRTLNRTTSSSSITSEDFDNEIMTLVSKYSAGEGSESVPSRASSSRAALREALRKRVTEAFENQSSKIDSLKTKLSETKSLNESIKKLEKENKTLTMENQILKTAGRERNTRAAAAQTKLKGENQKLRESINRLTRQTTEHQDKIMKLAAKQADLQRKRNLVHSIDHVSTISTISNDNVSVRYSACDSRQHQDVVEPGIEVPLGPLFVKDSRDDLGGVTD